MGSLLTKQVSRADLAAELPVFLALKKSCLSLSKITEAKSKEQRVFWALLSAIRRKEAVFPIKDSFTKEENPEVKLLLDAEA